MEKTSILRVSREPHWLGKFRLEYDGKYISIFGEDKNYPGWGYGGQDKEWFEEMCLAGAIAEGRNLKPEITKVTDEYIYINIGDERESLAWTNMVKEGDVNIFVPRED